MNEQTLRQRQKEYNNKLHESSTCVCVNLWWCGCRCACAKCRCPMCVSVSVSVWVRCSITRYAIWKKCCEWLFDILNSIQYGSMSISIAHLYAFDENLRYEISQLRTAHMIFNVKLCFQAISIGIWDVNICMLLSKIQRVAAANAELIFWWIDRKS